MSEEVVEQNEEENQNSETTKLVELEKKLIQLNPKIFEGVKKEKKDQLIQSFAITLSKTHIGPLPDPETLEGYARLIPDGANRVMNMAEKQMEHRMFMERKVIGGQIFQSNLGQLLAFVIAISFLSCATYCILNGHEWPGTILGAGGLTALVTAFIKGKEAQRKNLAAKKPEKLRR